MGMIHGGWIVAKILKREGVEVVFTLSGGHIAAIYDGCKREGIRVVDTRHEQAAVHAAEGWAKCTRTPGVAILTAGPGVTDGITGVANAYLAGSPILVIGGAAPFHLLSIRAVAGRVVVRCGIGHLYAPGAWTGQRRRSGP